MNLVFVVTDPTFIVRRLQPLTAVPELTAAISESSLRQSIVQGVEPAPARTWWQSVKAYFGADPGDTDPKAIHALLVTDEELAALRLDPAFLGKGLLEVQTNSPLLYPLIAQRVIRLADGKSVVRQDMQEPVPVGATVLKEDQPLHTFAGYSALTGDEEKK